jgi:hypothetical protein
MKKRKKEKLMSDKHDLNLENNGPDIVEVKQWKDKNSGMTVVEECSYPEDPNLPTISTYYGKVQIGTQMGPLGIQFIFPKDYDINQCFENFEKHAEAALEQMQKEQQQQIVVPNGINPDSLRV